MLLIVIILLASPEFTHTCISPHCPLTYKTIHTNSTLVRNLRANRLQNVTPRLQQPTQ